MLKKTKIVLSAAIVLSTTFPAPAATKHRHVTHAHRAIYNFIPDTIGGSCPANGGPSCSNEGPAPPDSW
jgi:hypothetical protein